MIKILSKPQQASGAFNNGEIIENKPIGFPRENLQGNGAYSNLFYWAHAKAQTDSTIGLHPHQGFEICSFVLKGEIRHYDTKLREWRPLSAGDAQIIRAGNGISHSEFMANGAEMFQIWFDPNLQKTLQQPASYDDYKATQFPVNEDNALISTIIVGDNSPFRMNTPGIRVRQEKMSSGSLNLSLDPNAMYSFYLLSGALQLNGKDLKVSDFFIVQDENNLTFQTDSEAEWFVIESPLNPGYKTYA